MKNKVCKKCKCQDCFLVKVPSVGYFCEDCLIEIVERAKQEGLL